MQSTYLLKGYSIDLNPHMDLRNIFLISYQLTYPRVLNPHTNHLKVLDKSTYGIIKGESTNSVHRRLDAWNSRIGK